MENEVYEKARRNVSYMKDFLKEIIIFLAVNVILVIINLSTYPQYFWFIWPIIVWGAFIGIRALSVFFVEGKFNEKWEEEKINKFVEKQDQKESNEETKQP